MERLTEREGIFVKSKFKGEYASQNILTRLADYEDAEEQGLLLRLPCKVGDTLYEVSGNKIVEHSVREKWRIARYVEAGLFGTIVFLTREEAEKALAEMQKG